MNEALTFVQTVPEKRLDGMNDELHGFEIVWVGDTEEDAKFYENYVQMQKHRLYKN